MEKKLRYSLLDALRGVAIIAMIIYHLLWDLVHVADVSVPWLYETPGVVFQLMIRNAFILISGFCWSLGGHKLRRALITILASALITAVTCAFTPSSRILFGVLSLLGTAMLVMIPLDKLLSKINPIVGLAVFLFLFIATRYINDGKILFLSLPESLYANYFSAYLGFPSRGFWSSDYVPVLPWIFLYIFGYFLYLLCKKYNWLSAFSRLSVPPLEFLGRHSLIIYMLHQPILYGLVYLLKGVL